MTIIRLSGPNSTGVSVSGDSGDWWYPNRMKFDITGSYKRGATELTVGDTKPLEDYPHAGIGELVQISIKGDKKLPVMVRRLRYIEIHHPHCRTDRHHRDDLACRSCSTCRPNSRR